MNYLIVTIFILLILMIIAIIYKKYSYENDDDYNIKEGYRGTYISTSRIGRGGSGNPSTIASIYISFLMFVLLIIFSCIIFMFGSATIFMIKETSMNGTLNK